MGTREQPSAFGQLLRQHRGAQGLSQEELAERAGMTMQAISALERGVNLWPYRATVARLAEALALAPSERGALEAAARRPPRRAAQAGTPAAAHAVPARRTIQLPETPLVGRADDLSGACALLQQPQVCLLTLTGTGGIGKTRLALQIAAEVAADFTDGVAVVDLSAIGEPDLVPPAIAHALGLAEGGGQTVEERLRAYLRGKNLLLVLDNFEQVADAAPWLSDLLVACPSLKALVTSRAPLRVRAEYEIIVPPLALPAEETYVDLPALSHCAAVALFVQRAQAAQPAFALTATNAAAVAAICTQLDGLPLAIELAAARVTLLPPRALLSRLESRLRVLTGGARDLPARQQTLRGTIDWSYALLNAGEQTLFAWLSVFVGGCTLEAAEDVCARAGDVGVDVLDGVRTLVEQSLLRREPEHTSVASEVPRLRMLDTLREYAQERLVQSGREGVVRAAHAAHVRALVEEAEPQLTGPEQGAWLDRLELEHDNLRAALRWARDSGEVELGLRLAGALWHFWYRRGHLREGRSWLEALLALGRRHDGTAAAASVWAQALNGAGMLASVQGDFGHAAALLEESLTLRRAVGDQQGISAALGNLGIVAYYQGDYERAAALHAQSLALERELGDTAGIAASLDNLGLVALEQGDYGRAAALYAESLALERTLGDIWGVALVCNNLGTVLAKQGEFGRAAALLEESLAGRRELGDRGGMAASLNSLAYVARQQGEERRAAGLHQESLRLCQGLDDQYEVARGLEGLAAVAGRQGQPERAARLLGAASGLRASIGMPLPLADRAEYERAVAAARTALGEAAFAAAWASGQGLAPEQAIALALEDAAGSCGAID